MASQDHSHREIVLLLLTGLCAATGPAWPDRLIALSSNGDVEWVDSENPGRHAPPEGPPVARGKAGGVEFNVWFDTRPQGFNDPEYGPERQARALEAVDYLASVLDHTGSCSVTFTESDSLDAAGMTTLYFSGETGFDNGCAFDHITSISSDCWGVDMVVIINFTYPYYCGLGLPPWDMLDLKSHVLSHLAWGLGAASASRADGSSCTDIELFTVWDSLLETHSGKRLWTGSPPKFRGVPGDLTGHAGGVWFAGPYATAAFGYKPQVYSPDPFQPERSLTGWRHGVVPGLRPVLERPISYGETARLFTILDKAALKDLGYRIRTSISIDETDNGFRFTRLPKSAWLEEGDPLSLEVATAGGVGNITYQWRKYDVPVAGATDPVYGVPHVTFADSGLYVCWAEDQSPTRIRSCIASITVFPANSLPVHWASTLAIAAAIALLGLRYQRRPAKPIP